MEKNVRSMLIRIIVSAALLAGIYFIPVTGLVKALLYLIPFIITGYDIILSALKHLAALELLNEDLIIAIAAIGLFLTGLIKTDVFLEAPLLLMIIQLSRLLFNLVEKKQKERVKALLSSDEKVELIDSALERKAPIERAAKRFTKLFLPLLVSMALIVALVPPIFRMVLWNFPPLWELYFYRAFTLILIGTPTALLISLPIAFRSGLSSLAKEGIYSKDENNIERLSRTSIMCFDSEESFNAAGDKKSLCINRKEILLGSDDEKMQALEKILRQRPRKTFLAFASDRPSEDSALLQRADVGIVLGAKEPNEALSITDTSIEENNAGKLSSFLSISRKTISMVRSSIAFVLIVKLLCLFLSAYGLIPLTAAVGADVLIALLMMLNSNRELS